MVPRPTALLVPHRRRLNREGSRPDASCPVGLKTFEPKTISSPQSEMSVPRIFSHAPSPLASAVSKKLIPASRTRWNISVDVAHVLRAKHLAFDQFLPRHHRRRMERRLLGDGGVGAVDPRTADLEVRLAGAGVRIDRRVDHCRVEVGASGITGTGCVAAAPWLPFRMRDLAVSFYRCPIGATNIPAPEMKIWSPSWRRLRAFGPAYGIQREDEDHDRVSLEGAR